MVKILAVFVSLIGVITSSVLPWDYGANRPELWPFLEGDVFADCKSDMQSPINILTEHVKCDEDQLSIKPVKLHGYNDDFTFNFTNAQFTIKAGLQDSKASMNLSGSGIPRMISPFKLIQFHFHWGQHDFEGSEHVIDDKVAPLELHLVHVSTEDPHFFAVVGILFEIHQTPNPHLSGIIEAADYLATHVNDSYLSKVNLYKLLPPNLNRFYFYEGSLTTPPCTERVFWTLMADRVGISDLQLKKIQANPTKINYRPPQPLNERYVKTIACELAGDTNNSNSFTINMILLVFALCLVSIKNSQSLP